MPSLNHVHQLIRIPPSQPFGKQWKCADPYCTFRAALTYVLDKVTKCNGCESEMILNREASRRAKPMCVKCSNTIESRRIRETEAKVTDVLSELGLLEGEK